MINKILNVPEHVDIDDDTTPAYTREELDVMPEVELAAIASTIGEDL